MIIQALKSNWKRKIICFFIIIQITISMATLIDAIALFEQTIEYKNRINSIMDVKDKYTLELKTYLQLKDSEKYADNIFSILNEIENNSKIQSFTIMQVPVIVDKFINVDKNTEKVLSEMLATNERLDNMLYVSSYYIDENFTKNIDLKIKEGRGLKSEDFLKDEKGTIPVLAGYDFIGKLKEGSKFSTVNGTYEVVGFLEENQSFLSPQRDLVNAIEDLRQNFIIPTTKQIKNDPGLISTNILNGGILFSIKPEYKNIEEEVIREIEGIYEKNGLEAESINLGKKLEQGIKENQDTVKDYLVRGSILTIFAILTLNVVMINYIKMREREFGIRISCGASLEDIIKQVVYEILILIILAIILDICFRIYNIYDFTSWGEYFLFKNQTGRSGSFEYSITTILKSVAIVATISLLSCVLPILKIKKISIKDLIRGL